MKGSRAQFVSLLRRAEPRLRGPIAVLAVVAGLLLVAHALYLGWYRPGMLAGVPLGHLLPGFQLLLGIVLSTVGLLGRGRDATPATSTSLGVGLLVLLTGPASPLTLGLVPLTVVAGVTLVCVGLPALVLVSVDTGRLDSRPTVGA